MESLPQIMREALNWILKHLHMGIGWSWSFQHYEAYFLKNILLNKGHVQMEFSFIHQELGVLIHMWCWVGMGLSDSELTRNFTILSFSVK